MVCYAEGEIFCGRAAKDRFKGSGAEGNEGIVRSPKRMLGKGSLYVNGREMTPSQIVADLVRYLKAHASLSSEEDINYDKAVVSIPVAMDGRMHRELRDAFLQAGINIVQFVHEPLAALYAHFRVPDQDSQSYQDLQGELALVFDWGGGTLDLTLCELGSDSINQIANYGDNEVGGDYIDEIVMRYVLDEVYLSRNFTGDVSEASGARAKLLEQCEAAKIALSTRETALIIVPNFFINSGGDDSLDFSLSREKFEELVEAILDRGIKSIDTVLEKLDIDRRRIALCLATGGVVDTPSVRQSLIQLFGASRLHISKRGNQIISEDCAWIAHDEARLKLAKPIEIVEARQSFLAVFKAVDPLPTEGEAFPADLILYCVDPRDGLAKIKLARPRQVAKTASMDHRDTYTNLSVRVQPEAKPFMERIDLSFLIDHDLIVRVLARSALIKDSDSAEILDLEFSIDARSLGGYTDSLKSESVKAVVGVDQKNEIGEVTMRANVSSKINRPDLVPGELLYSYDKKLFDLRNQVHVPLPQIVVDEKLFYQDCGHCGRKYKEPDCKCGALYSR